MSPPLRRRRTVILSLVFLALAGLWVVSYAQTKGLEKELESFAEEKIRYLAGSEENPALEFARPVITVSREYILVGKAVAKVALYMRIEHEDGKRDKPEAAALGHRHAGNISGVEYFLEKSGGQWADKESGQCSSGQCQIEGARAFGR